MSQDHLHPVTRTWFDECFDAPTKAQSAAWDSISQGESTLLMAPTGSGKTLAAFLFALDRLMFKTESDASGCKVLYISPIKALAVDVERNLRAPLTGMAAVAQRLEVPFRPTTVGIRSGDTPPTQRARMLRHPPDILITTPESFYLMLTSKAEDILKTVDVVIIDEIHAVVPSKRGAHLLTSIERLEAVRTSTYALQRIGLSATQRPLAEVARLLSGFEGTLGQEVPRPVRIVDASDRKELDLRVEMPLEELSQDTPCDGPDLDSFDDMDDGPYTGRSIWPAIYPLLVEYIREHRSTLIFVNARRSAERLANAINEVAGEELALAHHGSLAHRVRQDIEDRLKAGVLPAIVATASLELGIDMGAIDLVIQVEAPPSIASGIQRIGRAQHHVGGVPKGITFPKYRSDLVACAAASRAMRAGLIEETHYPRNPLDVLAQQIVAIVSRVDIPVDDLFALFRRSAPFAELTRALFESVLDMLSGRYPSDDFSDLKPRITWDRINGNVQARRGAQRLAVINGGTIPDRGLYGVFLVGGEDGKSRRVGELDEEMVFESRVGEVFLLGASSWRVEDITHDKVLVSPAPGEPGKMPFWHGDRPGRPLEFGRTIGHLLRELSLLSDEEALSQLVTDHDLNQAAALGMLEYVREQVEVGSLPTDQCVVIERFLDEIGDWRICILSPFGSRVHAPWAMAIRARLLEEFNTELDVVWSDDGLVFRMPDGINTAPDELFFPDPRDVEDRIIQRLAETSLFAARFRENAGRALLLPKKRPDGRSPLWAIRRRAASLLSVASQFRDFPIVLETYRECLQDQFDVPGLKSVLRDIAHRKIRVLSHEVDTPSPFASALMFQYVANFMYDGDAPLAERRAHALTIDQAKLRELLGESALRQLLDADAIATIESQLLRHHLPLKSPDDVHDILLSLGPLDPTDIRSRAEPSDSLDDWLNQLLAHRRVVKVRLAGRKAYAAAEDAARLRDGLGVVSPPGLPTAFLEPVKDPLGDLVMRYARTHGPFLARSVAEHYGLGLGVIEEVLRRLQAVDRVIQGEYLPEGTEKEWCESQVLRRIKRASLEKLRAEVQSVEPDTFARFLVQWHGLHHRQRGLDALLDAIEKLQGTPLPASILETDVLPARIADYSAAELDALMASGEVLWMGLRASGPRGGRIALFSATHFGALAPIVHPLEGEQYDEIRGVLQTSGALFFTQLAGRISGTESDCLKYLWDLVWNGEISNDSLVPLRSMIGKPTKNARSGRRRRARGPSRSRRVGLPGSEGRWWLLEQRRGQVVDPTQRRMAVTQQLLDRYGVLAREVAGQEELVGGFSGVYPLLKAMEDSGLVRRGYFIDGLGATQFAQPGAEDALRSHRQPPDEPIVVCLAATDPANPYGSILSWPVELSGRPERAPGAKVILLNGRLVGFLSRSGKTLSTRLSEDPVERKQELRYLFSGLVDQCERRGLTTLLLEHIDGEPANGWFAAQSVPVAHFHATSAGLFYRRQPQGAVQHA